MASRAVEQGEDIIDISSSSTRVMTDGGIMEISPQHSNQGPVVVVSVMTIILDKIAIHHLSPAKSPTVFNVTT